MHNHFVENTFQGKEEIAKNIHKNAWAFVGVMKENLLQEYNQYLDKCSWYNYHVKGKQTEPVSDRNNTPSFCSSVSMHDVILAPNWFELSLDMTEIAKNYLMSDDIVLYSVNAFYSNAMGNNYEGVQTWHRDYDSKTEPFLAMFMYLTDVPEPSDGAHVFEQRNGERVTICGPAGTVFFADTRQMHMGIKPTKKGRGMCWARWSSDPHPWTYDIDNLSPLNKDLLGNRYPENEATRKIIRKIVS